MFYNGGDLPIGLCVYYNGGDLPIGLCIIMKGTSI